jgi:hypothetical protein
VVPTFVHVDDVRAELRRLGCLVHGHSCSPREYARTTGPTTVPALFRSFVGYPAALLRAVALRFGSSAKCSPSALATVITVVIVGFAE